MDERTHIAVEIVKVLVADQEMRAGLSRVLIEQRIDPFPGYVEGVAKLAFAVSDAILKEAENG